MSEFNLSEFMCINIPGYGLTTEFLPVAKVKEFIKKLKEELRGSGCEAQKDGDTDLSRGFRVAIAYCLKEIDKLAGDLSKW